jgi:hypothetical protein
MNALLRIVVIVASFAIAAECASQQPASGAETSCSDEDHCQVVVTIACSLVMMCNASVDFEGVNARGNNVFWKIADQNSQQFAFDPSSGIEFKTDDGRRAFDCMPVGQRFKCRNLREAPQGKYFYSVKVVGVPRIDPWVVNH